MTHACVAALDAAPAHELRHSAARVLAAAGVPLEEVVYVLGHTSTRVTSSVYRHRTTPDAEAAVKTTDRPARPAGTRVGLEVQRPSLARLLARPAVAPVIVEAETIDELRANASASDVDRTREQRDAVSILTADLPRDQERPGLPALMARRRSSTWPSAALGTAQPPALLSSPVRSGWPARGVTPTWPVAWPAAASRDPPRQPS